MKFSRAFSLFKGVKREPNSFSYTSRFYDREREEKDKRRKYVELEIEREKGEERSISFSRKGQEDWLRQSYRKQAFNSNVIFIVILLILCLIALGVINYLDTVNV